MKDDENGNPVDVLLSSVEEAALDSDPASDSASPKDVWWLRWLNYGSIIVFPAIVLGLGFLFEGYIEQFSGATSYQRELAQRSVQHDSIDSMKFRFFVGACVGGGLGMIYVGRCIVRKADP